MKIEKVSYGRTYSLGSFQSERIDVEASIDETDNIAKVFDMLKGICDGQHKINNPEIYREERSIVSQWTEQQEQETILTTYPPQQPQTQEEKITQLIKQASSLPELEQWKLLSNNPKYPQLKELYQQKLKELTNE